MKLLALDTSTEYLSLAILNQGQLVIHHQQAGAMASQLILPQIQHLLSKANLVLSELNGIAFGAGPGAFTGVRVAVGVAQGLAFGAKLPVIGLNTLNAVAEASGESKVIVCLDARMGEVYHAVYQKNGKQWIEIMAASVCKPESVPKIDGKEWVGVGSGWRVHESILSQQYQHQLDNVMPDILPTAEAIIALAKPQFEAGLAVAANLAMPVYVRNRVALTTQEREQGLRL
jgi:tRNA threonylcarbamoyladenosine biosynthesis protein TsaB